MQGHLIQLIYGPDGARRYKPPDIGWRWQLMDETNEVRAQSRDCFRTLDGCLEDCRSFLFDLWSYPHILFPVQVLTDIVPEAIAA